MGGAISFRDLVNKSVFLNRDILFSQKPPGGFIHRDEQKNELILELSKIITIRKPCYLFMYGSPGTGKTALINEVISDLKNVADENDLKITDYYLNCSEHRTENAIMCGIINKMNRDDVISRIKQAEFISEINNKHHKEHIILILDEIDFALKESSDEFLYNLALLNEKSESNISIIFISNDLKVYDYIKPRTQNIIGKTKIIFPPYDIDELKIIIKNRINIAFKQDIFQEEVINIISEKEANRKGDARSALELVDACGKIATQKGMNVIDSSVVEEAESYLEKSSVLTKLPELGKHHKLVLLSILNNESNNIGSEVNKRYIELCSEYNIKPVSDRRVRTIVTFLDELDLIFTKVKWVKELNKKSKQITIPYSKATQEKAIELLKETI
ncbi:AAA family ATPase [Candidatus Woesearchaeota archaeon]|nr:AAA family ATPase [Candidatus Woesearchaeota archaeon]